MREAELPFIYVSNHKSWIDHFIIITASLRRKGVVPIHLIVADKIWSRPLVGGICVALGAYPARAGRGIEVSLAPLKKELARGECVGIYPEGGCVRAKDVFGEPKVGASYLAYHTGREIVPMAIKGLEDLSWISLVFGGRKVTLKFGKPFRINSEALGQGTPQEMIERGRKFIMYKIVELYRSIPD